MDLFQAIILGLIQGITEWLPISSSGHLVLAEHFFDLTMPLSFDIIIQLGSVLVVILFLRKEILELIVGLLRWEKKSVKLALMIFIASFITAIVGFTFYDAIKSSYYNLTFNGICFLITAALLFLSRYPKTKKKSLDYKGSFLIGAAQALSILPAVSRSGATISAGMMAGYKREEVAKFSFIIVIPAMLGAALLEIMKGGLTQIADPGYLAIATIIAAFSGYFSLKLLFILIKKDYFSYFALYCAILGIVLLFL